MKGEGSEESMDSVSRDIQKLSDKVDKVLEETEIKFARCPRCDLPTHRGQDSRQAFCANCNAYYDVSGGKDEKKKLKKKKRKISTVYSIAAVVVGLLVIGGIGAIAYSFYNFEKDPGYIDIEDVNDLRGLPRAESVDVDTMTTHELEVYLKESIDNETRKDIRIDEAVYKFFFIIPDWWDLVDIYENESTGAGIAGFYDTDTERMYVIGDTFSRNYMNSILAHEYTHALQDQNFDLDSIFPTGTHDGDLSLTCAIEGDAMRIMDLWVDKNLNDLEKTFLTLEQVMQAMSSIDLDGDYYSSEILYELAYFPYTDGLEFVKNVYQEGGMDAVNDLFTERPPLSTEQIIHFDKYMDYEEPMEVEFTGDTAGLDLQFTTTIGEKILSEVIGYNLYTSDSGAVGWGGDRFYHYTSGDDFLDVFVTEWDTRSDNARFASDYQNVLDFNSFDLDDIYNIGGKYAYMESSGYTTTVYMSSSLEILDGYVS